MSKKIRSIWTRKTMDGITSFYLGSCELTQWLAQNSRENEVFYIDGYEGSLLDNSLVELDNGVAAIYEHYLNPWASDYYIEFARHNTDAYQKITDGFIENRRKCEEEFK